MSSASANAPNPQQGGLFKRMMPRGLYGRALLIVIVPMILLQVGVAMVFLERHWNTVTQRLSHTTIGAVVALNTLYMRAETEKERADITRLAEEQMGIDLAFTSGAALAPVAGAPFSRLLHNSLTEALEARLHTPFRVNTDYTDRKIEIQIAHEGGVLHARVPLRSVYAANSHIFIVWMLGISLVLIVIAVVFLRNQIRPIRRLAVLANRAGRGEPVRDVRLSGAHEVKTATRAFLRMHERLARHVAQRTDMLAGVSHDLRTPLTRFKLELAMLPESIETGSLEKDIAEMERMLDSYLDFARDARTQALKRTDMAALLGELCQNAQGEVRPVCEIEAGTQARIRPDAFKRCLENLISNACAYGTHVRVSAEKSQTALDIFVDDDGPGIPEDKREDVFQPFQRLDEARNQNRSGTGLGLAIARDIARAHGGDIALTKSPMGGLRASVHIPV